MKKFMDEFKAFALRGNVMDMAVGMIIAAAFGAIITAFIENIVNPIIGILFQADLSNVVLNLPYGITLGIGAFISAVINFVLMALVLFLIVKAVNKTRKPVEEAAPAKSDEAVALEEIFEILKKKGSCKSGVDE
ncbi:MAG: large conductance mechanosensitive channel protein MscL [Solobacterium sp.]|nr:large conductance mechanosensitive channel protein MscL [Solobacterium sp.]